MLAEGLKSVLGAGGRETAAGLLEGGDADLIESYQENKRRYGDLPYGLQCLIH